MPRKPADPKPLDLFLMLADSTMPRLSANAWKVVSYVAAQHLRVHIELLEKLNDPLDYAIKTYIESFGIVDTPRETSRPYRADQRAPILPGGGGIGRFAIVSLEEICRGVRMKRGWRDYGTGLSKSTAAAAIKEALRTGVLMRERHKSAAGRDLASFYAINWDTVQKWDGLRRKSRKDLSRIWTPPLAEETANRNGLSCAS
jgi:hypothetical protein